MSYDNQVFFNILHPYVIDSLGDKSTTLASTIEMPSLPLHLGTHLKEELNAYCFALKATRVFPISTQAEQTEDGEHLAND